MSSHWLTLACVKDHQCDLSHPEFDTLNGDPLPKHAPKSTLFQKVSEDSDKSEAEVKVRSSTCSSLLLQCGQSPWTVQCGVGSISVVLAARAP